MLDLVRELAAVDLHLTQQTAELRWGPATTVFALASLWWVKGPLLVGLGGVSDGLQRRMLPLVMLASGVAFLLASAINPLLKALVDRHRPPVSDPELEYVGTLPSSPSFPSGHAMTAFAAATAIAVLCPRMRWPALAIALLVAVSRPYLGVHFWADVVVGALLGAAIGAGVALAARGLRS
ncbi:MAG TPA: phosphatase PAP2 family protein [Solirubrobacteraceae bacterium]|nr:phosphatase PAP2 family protein [Solirubrobacteraceae bacterium]